MKGLINNPFVLGKDIPTELFCDRKQETDTLIKQIVNGRNVALISHRRLGKSGLIHHCLKQEAISSSYHTFYVDLYATSSLADMVQTLGNGDICTEDDIDVAENNILQLQEIAYESTLSMLPAKQKQVLFAIAKEGYATNITSGAFVKKHHLVSASSLQTALNALIDKTIVMRTDKGYRLEDFFFAMWLRKR